MDSCERVKERGRKEVKKREIWQGKGRGRGGNRGENL